MKQPAFTVVMAAYNSERTIRAAIDSVLAQTAPHLELIVVDDGSADDTSAIATSTGDPRIRCVRTENRGVSAARNTGIAHSRGDIITLLDSDDEAYPEWLATFHALFSDKVGIAFCGMHAVGPGGGEEIRLPSRQGPMFGPSACLFLPGSYAVQRSLMEEVGGFDGRLRYSENWELGLRLMATCRAAGLATADAQKPLISWNRPTRAAHTNPARLQNQLLSGQIILAKHREAFSRDPEMAANFLAVAGVAAARLDDLKEARRLLLSAVRRQPTSLRHYARLAAATNGWLASRVWGSPAGKNT